MIERIPGARWVPALAALTLLVLAGTALATAGDGEQPLPPRDLQAEADDGDVHLTWQPPVAGEADAYAVYRHDANGWTQVGTTTNTSLVVEAGEGPAVYAATTLDGDSESAYSDPALDTSVLSVAPCISIKPHEFPPFVIDPGCLSEPDPTVRLNVYVTTDL